MKPLLKYSLSLSLLFLLCMIIPGVVCVICGFNGIWASTGISLAVVCFTKGYVAKKIFGENTTHHSSPNCGVFLIIISVVSAVIKIYSQVNQNALMERLSYTIEISRSEMLSRLFMPILGASIFWSLVLGIATFIRGKQQKHNIVSEVNMNEIETNHGEINSLSTNENISTNISVPKSNNTNLKKSKFKIYHLSVVSILVILVVVLSITLYRNVRQSSENNNNSQQYLYVDTYDNIHIDASCKLCSEISPTRISYFDFIPNKNSRYCKNCISNEEYQHILNDNKINIQLNNIYDYFASNHSDDVYEWMFKSPQEILIYVRNGNIWDLHRLYTLKIKKPDNRSFHDFSEFLKYCGREDLVAEIPNLYTNITDEERDLYIKLYRTRVGECAYMCTGKTYRIEDEVEFNKIAKTRPQRREFMYDVLKDYLNLGDYPEFEKTIIE